MPAPYVPSTIDDIKNLKRAVNRGNGSFMRLMGKIEGVSRQTANSGVPRQIHAIVCGDSTAGRFWRNATGSAIGYPGILRAIERGTNQCAMIVDSTSITVSGTAYVYDNSGAGKYFDYEIHPTGQAWVVENSAYIKPTSNTQGNDWTLYYIKEANTATSTNTGTFELRNSGDSAAISVNGVSASLTFDCGAGVGNPLDAGKCQFLYFTLTVNATGGNYKLKLGSWETGNIAYNASAATVQAALEGLDASLTGNVGVSLSGTTYTILIKISAFGIHTLEWETVSLSGSTPNITYRPLGAPYPTFRVTTTAGTCRIWRPFVTRRDVNGIAFYDNFNRAGLRTGDTVKLNQTIANKIIGDIAPDIGTWQETFLQLGDSTVTPPSTFEGYSLANVAAYTASFRTLFDTAYDKTTWIVTVGYPNINSDPSDTNMLPARVVQKEAFRPYPNWIVVDLYESLGGSVEINALGSSWAGDGVHLGNAYNQAGATTILRETGLYDFAGLPEFLPVFSPYGLISGNLEVQASAGARLRLFTDNDDAYVQLLGTNRTLVFRNAAGTDIARFASSDAVGLSFLPNPVRLASTTGVQLRSGTGSPESVVTAPVGSLFLRTDGGASTTLYVKESGTGNTGWVAK